MILLGDVWWIFLFSCNVNRVYTKGRYLYASILGEVIGTMILIILGAGVCAGVNLKNRLLLIQDGLLSQWGGEWQ